MPKVFRPKIVHSSAKNHSKELTDASAVSDVIQQPPSPPITQHEKSVQPPQSTEVTTIVSPDRHVSSVAPDTSRLNPSLVDIDQPHAPAPQSNLQTDLFVQKKIKRFRSKEPEEALPDVDKPLNRSLVSLRALLRWTPVKNPPPSYRRERSTPVDEINSDTIKEMDIKKVESGGYQAPLMNSPHESTGVDVLAPQLRLDADGNIVLDENSLLVSIPTSSKLDNLKHVTEESGILNVNYNSFRSPMDRRGKPWKPSETLRFYRALTTLGCDFYLMSKLFPNRSRIELKRKFKRESRENSLLVNQALRNRRVYDLSALIPVSDDEEDKKADVKVKSRARSKRALKREAAAAKRSKYDPNKVNQTIDFVLGQTSSEHASSNPDLTESTSSGPNRNSELVATGRPIAGGLLSRMIAKKQTEINKRTTDPVPADTDDAGSIDGHASPPQQDCSRVDYELHGVSSLSDSVSHFTGRPADLLLLRRDILGEESDEHVHL